MSHSEVIAEYSDGSGSYTVTREDEVLTTDAAGDIIRQTLTRRPDLDAVDHSEWDLSERFASTPDLDDVDIVWVDGLAYEADWR